MLYLCIYNFRSWHHKLLTHPHKYHEYWNGNYIYSIFMVDDAWFVSILNSLWPSRLGIIFTYIPEYSCEKRMHMVHLVGCFGYWNSDVPYVSLRIGVVTILFWDDVKRTQTWFSILGLCMIGFAKLEEYDIYVYIYI